MPLDPYMGQIMPAGFGTIPKGWAPCNGQTLAIATSQALFSLLGTTYGGDGIRTFCLPNLQGRAVLGSDLGSVALGQVGGTESVTLTLDQLPSHNHALQASTTQGGGRGGNPAGNVYGNNTSAGEMIFADAGSNEIPLVSNTNITRQGGGAAHNNMQPFLAVNYMIALNGLYPPRN